MNKAIGTAASSEAAQNGEVLFSPGVRLTPGALPEVESLLKGDDLQSGASTGNMFGRRRVASPDVDEVVVRWHVLRATFGKEKEACSYINAHGGQSYCPCIKDVRLVKGRRRKVEESYIPNLLFAYGSIDHLKTFVYDNANLPYLRFYEGFREVCGIVQKRPLFIPDRQMESLRRICDAEAGGAFIPAEKLPVFKAGDLVRVKAGNKFAGVEGKVARYKGQQCVAVIVNGVLTVATAYIPTYQLEKIEP